MKNREFDIVIWGASSFTGKLVCQYLIGKYGFGDTAPIRWAMAGRNLPKLEKVRNDLKIKHSNDLQILIGDSFDLESLKNITSKTNVILTTVGPYLKYGLSLVDACVQTKTHYCDLTGEIPFIHQTMEKFHDTAVSSKVKIVHSCGFDSVPSDLGVLMLQEHSLRKTGMPLNKIRLYVKKMKGGVSGGTIASILELMKRAKDKSIRKILKNPFALYPNGIPPGPKQPNLKKIEWDDTIERWTGPFIMSSFNSAVVRRTNALLNFKYGQDFIYDEVSTYPIRPFSRIKAEMGRLGLGLIIALLYFRFSRWILKNTVLPKPGEGPSQQSREKGFFKLELMGIQNEKRYKVTVSCKSDPGYSGTALMIAESAVCLAMDKDTLSQNYGILTPATAMGNILTKRLIKGGMKFETIVND